MKSCFTINAFNKPYEIHLHFSQIQFDLFFYIFFSILIFLDYVLNCLDSV